MSSSSAKSELAKLEAGMAERPPVLRWRLDPVRRVQVAWFIDDPYVDTGGQKANRLKTECKVGHPFDESNTYVKTGGKRECRTCKKRHDHARRKAA